MEKNKLQIVTILLSLLFSPSIYSQHRLIKVDSVQISINTKGLETRQKDQPVIIFENGHGVPMDNWDRVVDKASKVAPTVTYNRPGIGDSESIDEEPTIYNVSKRLIRILDELDVSPPYILVGHSLGGLYVRGFANHYPETLAGLVIVDPADFTETLSNRKDYYNVLGWTDSKVDSLINAFVVRRMQRHMKSNPSVRREGLYLEKIRGDEFRQISSISLPNIPVHILTGGRYDTPEHLRPKEYDSAALFRSKMNHRVKRWTKVVQSVDQGMLFYSAKAGHYVQWDDPELVVASIDLIIKEYYKRIHNNN